MASKHILITGAGGGIGLEVARRYLRRDYRVLAVERDNDLAIAAARELGESAIPITCDLADPVAVNDLCRRIELDWAHDLQICFLNAGLHIPGDVIASSPDLIDLHLDVMLRSTAKLARSAAVSMVEQGRGHIVATVSRSGVLALPGSAAYSAAKAGLRAYLAALHLELADTGVTVGGVYPNAVDTALLAGTATSEAGALGFVGPISTVGEVADAVDTVISTGRVEQYVPRADGYSARLLQLMPGFTRTILPMASRMGERGRARYLAYLSTKTA